MAEPKIIIARSSNMDYLHNCDPKSWSLKLLLSLNEHDILVKATVAILSSYGFEVQYTIKGKKTEKIKICGDSGLNYYPDVIAKKGLTTLIGDIRTRGQRGTKNEIDRGVVQFLQAELDDWIACQKRPHGMIITSHGADKDAIILAKHFGIYILTLPMNTAYSIATLDVVSQRGKIIDLAIKNDFLF